jgi:hypothetical protein
MFLLQPLHILMIYSISIISQVVISLGQYIYIILGSM